ncbi:MAG: CxxxxCH/CxxCH domain-containing protein [Actinobacteria bacterium]|nr:CxxxxCH/CxxCH domain-containing protein [Actinomycetota bacterium]MSW92992.1 CxxxxCH/CxxCH domain-containing protein [Actinomycetota bacterium]MSX88394.1 CxxxxCH/CxxCH domain-containing protein [Actinomycetota bacterium]MSY73331.1 CxxxxCH/CxxCH domain-containing protein [Actinomycetota bacterium]
MRSRPALLRSATSCHSSNVRRSESAATTPRWSDSSNDSRWRSAQ